MEFSSNISTIITNILSKTNVRQEEIFRSVTNETNVLVSVNLNKKTLSLLAEISIKQNNLPMLTYFVDRGAPLKSDGNWYLKIAALTANKEILVYLLGKGADPLRDRRNDISYDPEEIDSYNDREPLNSYDMLYGSFYKSLVDYASDRYSFYNSEFGGPPFEIVSYLIKYFSQNQVIKGWEETLQSQKNTLKNPPKYYSKQILDELTARVALSERQLADVKKNLPLWREIQIILKKYED